MLQIFEKHARIRGKSETRSKVSRSTPLGRKNQNEQTSIYWFSSNKADHALLVFKWKHNLFENEQILFLPITLLSFIIPLMYSYERASSQTTANGNNLKCIEKHCQYSVPVNSHLISSDSAHINIFQTGATRKRSDTKQNRE